MVKICNKPFPETSPYQEIFTKYPFPLSDFQKYAIQAIEKDKHVLMLAHTGSGKTLPAEHAIQRFHAMGKKIIYTAPIKSLSNQKFHEFSKKFPHISFGILTGDVKFNPEADCLIMTTEILRNTLFQKQMIDKGQLKKEQLSLYFEMDIQNELGCVVFDEIHYINDRDRGKVWEETILMLPTSTLMVMLSATIDGAKRFARWIEKKKGKKVWIASTNERVVPLTHYGFMTLPKSQVKHHGNQNPLLQTELHKLLPLRQHHQPFQHKTFDKLYGMNNYIQKARIFVNKSFVLNDISQYLYENNKLPAICFVFSRKKVEEYAKNISCSLHPKDSKNSNTVQKRAKQIIMSKLGNHAEYTKLPEYNTIMQLLEKGIAIHHAGILPVLREMVEILFGEGFIQLLFATETFAVGINMPTKTVIFTSLQKFDGHEFRYLLPHEYTQMAGRAGRRGIDEKGSVIHLNNMFKFPPLHEYKNMLCGKPQKLESKFQIHFNLILRLISIQETNFQAFIEKSMLQESIQKEVEYIQSEIKTVQKKKEKKTELLQYCKTPLDVLNQYNNIQEKIGISSRKVVKKLYRESNQLKSDNKHLEKDFPKLQDIQKLIQEEKKCERQLENTIQYVQQTIQCIIDILKEQGFIQTIQGEYRLSEMGDLAANIQEIHCLVFAEILQYRLLNDFTPTELICILSCFANISIPRDNRIPIVDNINIPRHVKEFIKHIQEKYFEYQDLENRHYLNSGENQYELQFELCELMYQWCDAKTETDCKVIYQELKQRNIFLGEFIKAILKINNIANELEKTCTIQNNMKLLSIIKQIPELTLKNVATNQSLYL